METLLGANGVVHTVFWTDADTGMRHYKSDFHHYATTDSAVLAYAHSEADAWAEEAEA